jgi:N12 class adenine-specific DNA methylase
VTGNVRRGRTFAELEARASRLGEPTHVLVIEQGKDRIDQVNIVSIKDRQHLDAPGLRDALTDITHRRLAFGQRVIAELLNAIFEGHGDSSYGVAVMFKQSGEMQQSLNVLATAPLFRTRGRAHLDELTPDVFHRINAEHQHQILDASDAD